MNARLLIALLALTAQTAHAQVTRITLSRPDATLPEPFSVVRGARELPGARLLLADWIEQRVALADFRTGQVTDRGRTGEGPQEFLLPSALIPFRGDSTLLVDAGNARVAVLDGTGVIRRFLRAPQPAALHPGGADARGRIYFTIPPWHATRPLAGDSVELAAWDPATDAVRVIARLHGSTPSKQKPGEGPRIPYVVFAPQDTWTVSPDGAVAIVRADGYYVEWLDERGARRGKKQQPKPVAASAADRRDAARNFAANAAEGGRSSNGGTGYSAAPAETRSDAEVARLERASTFAPALPPFRPGSALADPKGRVWVARWGRAGDAVRYDVFDAAGAVVAMVELRPGTRLVAIGARHAYAVRADADELHWVERYALPAGL